jgi:hypothetical protein
MYLQTDSEFSFDLVRSKSKSNLELVFHNIIFINLPYRQGSCFTFNFPIFFNKIIVSSKEHFLIMGVGEMTKLMFVIIKNIDECHVRSMELYYIKYFNFSSISLAYLYYWPKSNISWSGSKPFTYWHCWIEAWSLMLVCSCVWKKIGTFVCLVSHLWWFELCFSWPTPLLHCS